jgi:iron complex outermembrane receptor protein
MRKRDAYTKAWRGSGLVLCAFSTLTLPLSAAEEVSQEPASSPAAQVDGLSLSDLLNLTVETASKQKQSLSDAPSIVSVMTKNDIDKMGVTSLIDVLKYVPGIEVSMGINGAWRVSIRGVRKDGNLLLLVNGIAVNDFYDGRAIFDLPTAFVERIEVIRGPGSPLFGTNAVAGIINIFTVKDRNYARVGVGTHATVQADAGYAAEGLGGKYSVAGGYTTTEGANVDPYSPSSSDIDEGGTTNRWVKDLYLTSNYEAGAFNTSFWALRRSQGPWVGPRYMVAKDTEQYTTTFNLNSSYKLTLSDNISIVPRVYAGYNIHDFRTEELPKGYVSRSSPVFTDGAWTKEEYTGLTLGTETQINVKAGEHLNILGGVVYESLVLNDYDLKRNFVAGEAPYYRGAYGNWDGVELDQKGRKRVVAGVFNENTLSFEQFNISAGFRYDDYSDFGSSFNPRSGIIYKPLDYLSFKVLYGQAFRAPTFKELYDKTDTSAHGILGNEDLKPEVSSSAEAGMELKFPSFIARGNVYENHTTNLLMSYDHQGSGGPGLYENTGKLKNRGFEIETNTILTKNVGLMANFSQFTMEFEWNPDKATVGDRQYIKTRGDQYVTNAPARQVNLGLDVNFAKLRNFVGMNYGGPSEANRRHVLEGQRNTKIPPYYQGNFRIAYDIEPNLMVQLAGNNLGKKKYSDPDEGTDIFRMGDKGMVQPGPTYVLSSRYDF